MSLKDNPVPFAFFCRLITSIGLLKPKTTASRLQSNNTNDYRAYEKLKSWIERLRDENQPSLPFGTGVIFFRLLFPEEGVRRRYMMKEATLIRKLEQYFKVNKGRFDNWCSTSTGSGCLGTQVEQYLLSNKYRGSLPACDQGLSLGRVDQLLDELASKCPYSSKEVIFYGKQNPPRDFTSILKSLLDPLTSSEISIVIQLILRDISPILYPPPSLSATIALNKYNTKAHSKICLMDAMKLWDSRMPGLYKLRASLDTVVLELEGSVENSNIDIWKPTLGIPVQVPKSERPGVPSVATKNLSGLVAIETKYDGERLQIHIDTSLPYSQQIQIFSKSGRDSTVDRNLLLPIIRASLGLSQDPTDTTFVDPRLVYRARQGSKYRFPSQLPSTRKFIIEGEMVVFNEPEDKIDEFWKLAAVKHGSIPHSHTPSPTSLQQLASSQDSYQTGGTASYERSLDRRKRERWVARNTEKELHLMVVWFDLLLVGEESLTECSYQERRARLESLVESIHGYSMLTDKHIVDFDQPSALYQLRHRFAHIIASRGEGLMLKPIESKYNDFKKGQKWVKLKKDFIPGAGDTLDFCILGARWDKKRGRELGIGPAVMTTFYVGLACDSPIPSGSSRQNKPHYHILFTTSYGLDRNQLEFLNHKIRNSKTLPFEPDSKPNLFEKYSDADSTFVTYDNPNLEFTFSLADHLDAKQERPTTIFEKVRIFELVGAGFQCSMGSPYYELRWARITKVDRQNGEPVDLASLQDTASKAMQFTTVDIMDQMWPTAKSSGRGMPGESLSAKLERETLEWIEILETADSVRENERVTIRLPTSSGSISIPASSSSSSSSSRNSRPKTRREEIDEGYASGDGNDNKRHKRLVPFSSITNLNGNRNVETSTSSRRSSRRKAPEPIAIYVDPSSSSSTISTTPATPDRPTYSPATTALPLSSMSVKALTSTLPFSSPPPALNSSPLASLQSKSTSLVSVISNVSLSTVPTFRIRKFADSSSIQTSVSSLASSVPILSWSTDSSFISTLAISTSSSSYHWTYIYPKSLATTSHPPIPNLHPFQPSNFYYDPFHVLQGAGWLGVYHSNEALISNGFLVVLDEASGRKLKQSLLHKFGVVNKLKVGLGHRVRVNRKQITILSLNGWIALLS